MTRRNSMLLAGVVVVAAVAAYWMLVLTPKREQAAKLSTSISAKQSDLKKAQAELATYEQARSGYKANYSIVARLGKAVPADDDVRSLLIQINAAARKSKVDFRAISVGGGAAPAPSTAATKGAATPAAVVPPGATTVGTAGFSQMPFTFTFKGSYFRLGEFMRRLDRFVAVRQQGMDVTGRLLVLDKISILPDITGFPNMRAQVNATTFLLPATQGLTAGATAAGPGAATTGAPATSASPVPAATTAPSNPTAAIGATP